MFFSNSQSGRTNGNCRKEEDSRCYCRCLHIYGPKSLRRSGDGLSLEALLGSNPPAVTLSADEQAAQAVEVFLEAQKAFVAQDIEALWPLLDCDSQSQASHFADQARERARSKDRLDVIAAKLNIPSEQIPNLDGKQVWTLDWTREDLSMFAGGSNPRFIRAAEFDRKLVPIQTGSKHKYTRRDPPEATVAFDAEGRTWQIPVRINTRNGTAEMKLYLRPPFYLRLRL